MSVMIDRNDFLFSAVVFVHEIDGIGVLCSHLLGPMYTSVVFWISQTRMTMPISAREVHGKVVREEVRQRAAEAKAIGLGAKGITGVSLEVPDEIEATEVCQFVAIGVVV